MVLTNLDQSGFRKLKLIKPMASEDGGYESLEQVLLLILDKSVPSLEPCKLLTQPPTVLLIDKFINKESDSVSSSSKKNATKSAEYRTKGNQEYGRRHFSQASYYYTMAIIYAPDVAEKVDGNVDDKKVPEELSLAYGNRSAVFYELGQYEAALADIDHSLATGYPQEKKPKLLLRKVECLISLKQLREAKRVWEQLSIIAEPKDERALKIRVQLLDIGSNDDVYDPSQKQQKSPTDPLIPVLNYLTRTSRYKPSADFALISAKVEPQYSEPKGRHLVAKQDIEPGDILMVESPFVSVLKKNFEYHFCHHCCRQLESKIDGESDELCITGSVVPCTHCTRVLYCSTSCRTEAWRTYHQYECSILAVLYKITNSGRLALRILLSTGLDVAQQVNDRIGQDDKSKDLLSSLKIRKDQGDIATNYGLVHGLIDSQDSIAREDLAEFVVASTVLGQLAKKCAFVRTNEQAKSATTIVYRHLRQLYSTMISINCLAGSVLNPNQVAASIPVYSAVGSYPHDASLMNHSCEPNSVSSFVQSTVLVHRASKKIVAGTEVTATYGDYCFMEQELTARRDHLWKMFHFQCECSRCVLEERDGLNGKYFPIGCEVCGSTLTRESSTSDTFSCSNSSCAAASMFLSEAQQLYARIETQLVTATRLIETFETAQTDQQPEENRNSALECQQLLSQLSRTPGLRNCWQLGELHRRLSDALARAHLNAEARQHFERYCEINEAYSGLARALTNHRKLILLYVEDDERKDCRELRYLVQQYRRIVNRTIELVRLELLAEVEPPPADDGLDLLVEESRLMRNLYRTLVETRNRLR